MLEAELGRLIQVALCREGAILLRNNVGALKDITGRVVRFGLGVGSSDFIGWMPDGRFLAVEVKTLTGRVTVEQAAFIAAVRKAGGVAFVARSVEEAVKEYRLASIQ